MPKTVSVMGEGISTKTFSEKTLFSLGLYIRQTTYGRLSIEHLTSGLAADRGELEVLVKATAG